MVESFRTGVRGVAVCCLAVFFPSLPAVGFDAVGVFPLRLEGGADNLISVPLERPALFQGRVAGVTLSPAMGLAVVLEAQPGWDFGALAGDGKRREYVACVAQSGPLTGRSFPILANGANWIQIAAEGETFARLQAELEGQIVRLVPYWTPSTLFAHTPLPHRTTLFLYDEDAAGTNKAPDEVFTFFAGYGWFRPDFSVADDAPLRRGAGLHVRLPENAAAVQLDVIGRVPPTGDQRRWGLHWGTATDVLFGLSVPEPLPLDEAGLEVADRTVLFAWSSTGGYNPAPQEVFTYFHPYGWYDPWFKRVDGWYRLEPGRAYRLQMPSREAAGREAWSWAHWPLYLDDASY